MKDLINIPTINLPIEQTNCHSIPKKLYKVYGIEPLIKSIETDGLQEPIVVIKEGDKYLVIIGRRKVAACKALRWKDIPAKVVKGLTEAEIYQLVIGSNQQRKKSIEETINEAEHVLGILGKSQGQRRDLLGDESDPEEKSKIGKDRYDIAAEMIGANMSGASLRRLMFVKDFEADHPDAKLGLVEKIVNKELTINTAKKAAADYVKQKNTAEGSGSVKIYPNEKKRSDNYTIHNKSSADMAEIANNSIPMSLTSVPYYDVRRYQLGKGGVIELGLEKTYQEYLDNMIAILREVYRVLTNDGSFFLNIGDSYSKKSNYLISSRLVLAVCDQIGFHCVNEIIWHKTNTVPQTTKKRLQPSYEKIFHLVKDPDNYYYEPFKIHEPDKKIKLHKIKRRNNRGSHDKGSYSLTKPYRKFSDFIIQQEFEDVITSSSAAADSAKLHELDPTIDHPAIFPSSICILPILTCSKPGDIILDPFSGSGSLGEAAILLGRKYIGYEVVEHFCALSVKRLAITETEIDVQGIGHIQSMVSATPNIDITHFKTPDEKTA